MANVQGSGEVSFFHLFSIAIILLNPTDDKRDTKVYFYLLYQAHQFHKILDFDIPASF